MIDDKLIQVSKVTGRGHTSGISLAVAQIVFRHGGDIVITGRRVEKTEAVRCLLAGCKLTAYCWCIK